MYFFCKHIIILLQHFEHIFIMLQEEVNMKKLFLIALLTVISVQLQSGAAVTVDQLTSPTYMHNNGYSDITTDKMTVQKARAQGVEYYTAKEKKAKKCQFIKRFFTYTDPSLDDQSFFHHDIKANPSYSDL